MSVEGTWNITLNTPMGAQPAKLVLSSEGGTLDGRIESGTLGDVPLDEVAADGNGLTFKASVSRPMPMVIEASAAVNGDEISGDLKLGSFGNATFAGTRA